MGVPRKPLEEPTEPALAEKEEKSLAKSLDYVALLATLVLGVVACAALYFSQEVVAGTATGAVAGYMMRLYTSSSSV